MKKPNTTKFFALALALALTILTACSDSVNIGGNNGSAEYDTEKESKKESENENKIETPAEPFTFENKVFTYDFDSKTTVLPTPTAEKLPVWRGFNLTEALFTVDFEPFNEDDFRLMAEWGFNFVRIPIDYRGLIIDGDWDKFSETKFAMLDKALEYGIKYDLHINYCLHRAPGHTNFDPPEATDIWKDDEPLEAFANMWGVFAERYKNVPNEYVSFNLLNEPAYITEEAHLRVAEKACRAIWDISPGRLIIVDGYNVGLEPSDKIRELGAAQSTRGYAPAELTHYEAEWAPWNAGAPLPEWPVMSLPRFLFGNMKQSDRTIFGFDYDFPEDYTLSVKIGTVCNSATLVIKADGVKLLEHKFNTEKDKDDCEKSEWDEQWQIYVNDYNLYFTVNIPSGTQNVTIENTVGDWMTLEDTAFASVSGNSPEFSFQPTIIEWAWKFPQLKIDSNGSVVEITGGEEIRDAEWLKKEYMDLWIEVMESGGGVMVGEFGCYNKTPHDVVLRWMEDYLKIWKDAGIGWAMWNFDGTIGIINSGRADVEYEDLSDGRKLDRAMLELLRKY
ncbi:MAG: glycoside hydrolase family 5 protein [Oscillospiraceae bacterium]|nr:glycoside hydrolase family 5 protein [Oscillospiraceae bacterium]